MKLRPVLQVPSQRQLRGGIASAAGNGGNERRDEPGELQFSLDAVLLVVLVTIALQPRDSLESAAQLHAESLGATKTIPVLIAQRGCGTQVAGCIGSLRPKRHRPRLTHANIDVNIKERRVWHLLETNIGIPHRFHTAKTVICFLQIGGTE